MSAIKPELVLECVHCGCRFVATESQWKHRNARAAACSAACRLARLQKPRKPLSGPCQQCGQMFRSRGTRPRLFCSMSCYVASDVFQRMLAENRKRIDELGLARGSAPRGDYVRCLECGSETWQKPSQPRRFCSHVCYRAYMAKRFDRWIAQPQTLALPQGFDEFLSQNELPCLIEGCTWSGRHLGTHVQLAHGFRADDFKRAAGFNVSTGLVVPDLHEQLCESNAGKGCMGIAMLGAVTPRSTHRYQSLEGREHIKKAMALAGQGPTRECAGCGQLFTQSTPFGRAKYCCTTCRDWWYALAKSLCSKRRVRLPNGRFMWRQSDEVVVSDSGCCGGA